MTTTGPTRLPDLRAIPGHPGACLPGEGISFVYGPGRLLACSSADARRGPAPAARPGEMRRRIRHRGQRPRRGRLDQEKKL
jgi:hypothetical protein